MHVRFAYCVVYPLQKYVLMLMTVNNRNKFLTSKLLKQGYRYHKLCKAFSQFYYRHYELIVKYNICLKTLLQQRISESVFYGDLVYKFQRIVGTPRFSDQFERLLNVIKEWDTAWISCDSLHAWLRTQSRLIAMVSSLIARRWVRPQT